MEIRKHLNVASANKVGDGFKQKVLESIIKNEDVLFYWTLVATDWEEEEASVLLEMVAELFVTIRVFAFVGSWMELYKQKSKTSTQKSKGVRKCVITKSGVQ